MRYSLRQATEADHAFLYALHAATIRDAVAATWGWDDADQRRRFAENWDPGPRRIILVDDVPAGVLWTSEEATHRFLDLIEIHPAFQGRGLGTAIIVDLVRAAHADNRPVVLSVLRANPRARRLYQRLGFTVSAEKPERLIMTCAVGRLADPVRNQRGKPHGSNNRRPAR